MFLLLAGIVLLSSDARAQTMSFGRGDGTFGYDWTNFGAVGQGDTLVVRQVLIATGEVPVAVPFEPCGIELVTTAAIRAVSEACSERTEMLAPGDSIWAEQRWIVESEPGRYEYALRSRAGSDAPDHAFSSGTWDVQEPDHRRAVVRPPNRLPIVLHANIVEGDHAVREREVEGVIQHVASSAGRIPIPVTPAAAEAMEGLARRLEVSVELGPDNRFQFGACWFDLDGSPMPGSCPTEKGGIATSLMLGVLLRDFVHQELEWLARRADD